MKKAYLMFLLLFFSVTCAAAQDRIVAIVNNEVITQKDLDSFTTFTRIQLSQKLSGQTLEDKLASLKKDLLQRLIEDRLILQEAKKSNLRVDESRVKSKVAEVKKRYESEREFTEALVQQGLSESDVEGRIKEQMMMYSLIDSKIRSKIQIKPAEITEYYSRNKQDMVMPERREVSSIAADSEQSAKAMWRELKQGKDINALAKERDAKVSNFSAKAGELKKEIDGAVFQLNIGQVSEPLNVNGVYYVFKVNAVLSPQVQPLIEVQDAISALLFEKKMQEAVAAWLEELRKSAYIKITE